MQSSHWAMGYSMLGAFLSRRMTNTYCPEHHLLHGTFGCAVNQQRGRCCNFMPTCPISSVGQSCDITWRRGCSRLLLLTAHIGACTTLHVRPHRKVGYQRRGHLRGIRGHVSAVFRHRRRLRHCQHRRTVARHLERGSGRNPRIYQLIKICWYRDYSSQCGRITYYLQR